MSVLIGMAFVCATIGYRLITGKKYRWEPLLHLVGMISADEAKVRQELQSFLHLARHVIWHLEDTNVLEPPARLADYFEVAFPDKELEFGRNNSRLFQYLQSGVDPWGSEFVFNSDLTRDPEGGAVLRLTLRSIGANEVDEHGKGDDLQRELEWPCLRAPRH